MEVLQMANKKVGRPRKNSHDNVDMSWCNKYLAMCEARIESAKKALEEAIKHGDTDTAEEIDNMLLQVIDLCNTYRRAMGLEESDYNYK